MTRNAKRLWPALIAIFLVQSAALGWMIWNRVMLLKTGREITLDVVPVDPRSLFRGDYVILSYPISRVPADRLEGPPPARNAPVYVRLAKGEDGWRAVAVTAAYPASVPEGEGRALEKLVREKKLAAVLAIGADGEAAIKGLAIDGRTVYDEPLF